MANPVKLPGAFLFLTITLPDDTKFASVAYDGTITAGTTLEMLKAKYLPPGGLQMPYNERFTLTAIDAGKDVWRIPRETVNYGGVFGGTKGTPSGLSGPWPFKDAPLVNGVYISYWNHPKAKGLHTSAIDQRFNNLAAVPYATLYQVKSTQNLVPDNAADAIKKQVKAVRIDWYATHDGLTFNW